MPRINSCPIDRAQTEFVGISRHPTGKRDIETDEPIVLRAYWRQCTVCSAFMKHDYETGEHVETFPSPWQPNEKWFAVPRE